jgi:putative endonuclease
MRESLSHLQSNDKAQTDTRSIGFSVEQEASRYLEQHGLNITHRNFQCKLGEIDLIGFQGNTLVFVEVRYRKNTQFGTPAESVTYGKQRKIIRVAKYFLMKHKQFAQLPCRFDVIAVTIKENRHQIDWIQHAFY